MVSCATILNYAGIWYSHFSRSLDLRIKPLPRSDSPIPKKSKYAGVPLNIGSK